MGDDPFLKQAFSAIGAILGLTPQKPKMLDDVEAGVSNQTRRIPFDPRLPSNQPPPSQPAPEQRYIPGELDLMRQAMGIASDDPFQLAASLEAYRRSGYPDPNKPRR